MNLIPKPTFFAMPRDFRKWLQKNHTTKTELIVGFYKVNSGKKSITWSESVDEALCFGWIDGIRRSVDNESYCIRFTPRKPGSIWSSVNIKKMESLIKQDLMYPKGIEIFEKRKKERSAIYSYEKEAVSLSNDFEKKLKANKKAFAFFKSMPATYQKIATNWVMSAKQETTRMKRLDNLINDSEAGIKIKSQRY